MYGIKLITVLPMVDPMRNVKVSISTTINRRQLAVVELKIRNGLGAKSSNLITSVLDCLVARKGYTISTSQTYLHNYQFCKWPLFVSNTFIYTD